MKILIISYDFPYPPSGGSISRDYNLFKELAKYNELDWINRTTRGSVSEDRKGEMRKYFRKMEICEWDYPQDYLEFIKGILTKTPYIIRRFRSEMMREVVAKFINENDYDLILCDHIYLAQYLPEGIENRLPVIPNNEDCGFSFYKKMSENSSFGRKLYGKLQWKKILKYETDVLRRFGVYITTSDAEKRSIKQYVPESIVYTAENGVDTKYFRPSGTPPQECSLIYTAWFGYYPNVEAVTHFARSIFPLVRKELPEVRFYIVGKEPPDAVLKLGNADGITVTGYVEDVRDYFAKAGAAVIPLKTGGGTRLKILEAMASGVPVVSTRIGAEGLRAEDGKHLLIADSDRGFAQKVATVLKDKELSRTISANARALVTEHYDWERIGKDLNHFLHEFVNNRRAGR